MESRWSGKDAGSFVETYGNSWGEDLALRTYSSRLLGREKRLVLSGGGNTSCKGKVTDLFGKKISALYIKASGTDLASIEPQDFSGLELEPLLKLQTLAKLPDEKLVNQLRSHLIRHDSATPSMETLVHAFIPQKFIDHTHPGAILTLTNLANGKNIIRELFKDRVAIVDYVRPGFNLSLAAVAAYNNSPSCSGMILINHGLVTWGKTARESYQRTIDFVSQAEEYISAEIGPKKKNSTALDVANAEEAYLSIAPVLRGALALTTGDPDWPYERFILKPIISDIVLNFMEQPEAKEIALTSPLSTDYLIRTKAYPLWLENLEWANREKLKSQLLSGLKNYKKEYQAYFERNKKRLTAEIPQLDPVPRVIFIPGIGVVCAGRNADEAELVKDITDQSLEVKISISALGTYRGLTEEHHFDMEYSPIQLAKLNREKTNRLQHSVALVTGAAGAIGWGISQGLLQAGCHVALTDLAGQDLDRCYQDLQQQYGGRVMATTLDVTDPDSVRDGFIQVVKTWGGVDLVIANAGLAHVSPLADMAMESFSKLSRVNIDGTLQVIAEAARLFTCQETEGDIILISTKNVFAPGAKFGAYSATKAAAHQLARIASLELAELGVRVNMVSPDAVFSHQHKKSGLWAEVGPDRMKARGLDEKSLEAYYHNRNLLKSRITAEHVARAVLFFASHQTPTTGATIPVDGGLPDATPR